MLFLSLKKSVKKYLIFLAWFKIRQCWYMVIRKSVDLTCEIVALFIFTWLDEQGI